MHEMYELKEMLCEELKKITDKGEISASSLDVIDKLTHSIKSIETIMAMDGYSNDGSYMMGNESYARNRGSYAYAQRRDSRGRYSRANEMDDLKEDLRELMDNAQSEEQKKMIRNWMKQIER